MESNIAAFTFESEEQPEKRRRGELSEKDKQHIKGRRDLSGIVCLPEDKHCDDHPPPFYIGKEPRKTQRKQQDDEFLSF